MKNVIPFPTGNQAGDICAREEAVAWCVRIDRGDLTTEEQTRLDEWLRIPGNREMMRHVGDVWREMDGLSELAKLFPLPAETAAQKPPAWRRLCRQSAAAVVAGAIAVGLVLAALQNTGAPTEAIEIALTGEPTELVYETGIGQQTQAALKDGSTITLNTQSRISVQFSERERSIYLTAGEAHFDVEKDASRPFTVYVAGGSVRAVGTAFNVRLLNGRADIIVAEGVVEVEAKHLPSPSAGATTANAPAPEKQHAILTEGGSARISEQTVEATTQIPARAITNKLAWRHGKWIFEGETLAAVIAEVNRYTDRRIEIVDPHIGSLRVGGYFDIGDIESLLVALEGSFGIKSTQVSETLIQLSALDGDTHQ